MARPKLPAFNMELMYDFNTEKLNIVSHTLDIPSLLKQLKAKKKRGGRNKLQITYETKITCGDNRKVNPQFMSERKFHSYYRVTKTRFYEIHDYIETNINLESKFVPKTITTVERLLICLRFLGTASPMRSLGYPYDIGYRGVRDIILSVCKAISEKMGPIFMPKPTPDMWQESEDCYRNILDFPNCVGALYGKRVNVDNPLYDDEENCDYDEENTPLILALVNARSKFLVVDVGLYKADADGGIYEKSVLGAQLENGELQMPAPSPIVPFSEPLPHVVVADETFPLKPYLMTPYRSNDSYQMFNYRLSHARFTAENAFAIAKARWRILDVAMPVEPDMVESIILATCCLHNYLDLDDMPPDYRPEKEETDSETFSNLKPVIDGVTEEAAIVRNKFNRFFCEGDAVQVDQGRIVNQG